MKKIRIGILGMGQVGTGLVQILKAKRAYFSKELDLSFEIVRIAVKSKSKKRKVTVKPGLITDRAADVVSDPSVDIVVELVGGVSAARKLVKQALENGKHVVTANKALLAEHGDELFQLAIKKKRNLLFEASVGGGIPVIQALRDGLVANKVDSIYSIINGTSNYILTQMSEHGMDFKDALKQAQEKGFAEADPTFDIEGIDAAHKIAILAKFAFGGRVDFDKIYKEGISRIRKEDISFALDFGYRIKLLAMAKETRTGVDVRVQPTLLPLAHILANVNGAFNAVLLRGDEVGDTLLYGQGAGPHPTASAVISDLVEIARNTEGQNPSEAFLKRGARKALKIKSISSLLSRYYLRFSVIDRPGVLAQILKVIGNHNISISDCIQKETAKGKVVPLILLTHDAHEKNVINALKAIDRLHIVRGGSQLLRIEEK